MSYLKQHEDRFFDHVFIFVDKLSVQDKSVKLAECHDEKYGRRVYKERKNASKGYTEFDWVRVEWCTAQNGWCNLDIANMGIEELALEGGGGGVCWEIGSGSEEVG